MRQTHLATLACLFLLADTTLAAAGSDEIVVFDGTTLAGWHVSAASSHSKASGQASGGDWRVIDGAIVGRQDPPGNGGLLVTDRDFGDFEIVIETAVDWNTDSGLFLRSNDSGLAYQVMIDAYPGGTVGGVWARSSPRRSTCAASPLAKAQPARRGVPAGTSCARASSAIPRALPHGSTASRSSIFRIPRGGSPIVAPLPCRCMVARVHAAGAVRFRKIRLSPLD